MEQKTLGSILREIAMKENDIGKLELEYNARIAQYPEFKKLLEDCLRTAKYGYDSISMGRSLWAPVALEQEGILLEQDGSGYVFRFQ